MGGRRPKTAPSSAAERSRLQGETMSTTESRVTIGDGIPFVERLDRDIALHLAEVKAYKSGMVALRYEVRG